MYVCVFNGSSLIERTGFDNSQNNAGFFFFLYKIQTALNNSEYKYMHVHFLPSASPLQILGPRLFRTVFSSGSCSFTSFKAYVMQRIERQNAYLEKGDFFMRPSQSPRKMQSHTKICTNSWSTG